MVNIKESFLWLGSLAISTVFEYDTPKYVHIKNKKIGLLNRLIQLAIVAYVIGYGVIYKNEAQDKESVQSVVITKVKGVNLINNSHDYMIGCPRGEYNWSVYDHIDLVVPPEEPNSFFVTTNMWITCNQRYGICPEDYSVPDAICTSNTDCPIGKVLPNGNGLTNGSCSNSNGSDPSTCLIYGWCPTEAENDTITAQGHKIDVRDFTVLVKNSISFPRLDPTFRVRNIPPTANHSFLKDCRFDNSDEEGRSCPIFSLQTIIDMLDGNETYEELALFGAVIGLSIEWDCNLDFSFDGCKPKYTARRLDDPKAQISKGFNFRLVVSVLVTCKSCDIIAIIRYAKYYQVDGEEVRDVWKVYGIKFLIQVSGQVSINIFKLNSLSNTLLLNH
jgi:P2X purinoceptor 4